MTSPQLKDLERGELPGAEPPLPPYEAAAGAAASVAAEEQQPFLTFDPEPVAPPVYTGGEMEMETEQSSPPPMSVPMKIFTTSLGLVLFAVGQGLVFTLIVLYVKGLLFVWKKIGLVG
ncbi:hypothetical protein GGS26DRAFT_592788 [Hypomontagnella submonticulosa]|nr:hypothetical protein GGS26DRAFT_592788 [Hypomontagnella submonticulosa]